MRDLIPYIFGSLIGSMIWILIWWVLTSVF